MTAITEQEAEEFISKMKEGHQLLKRSEEIISKESKDKKDREELARIQNRLNEINIWFNETGRF